jgi:hypothetical protein
MILIALLVWTLDAVMDAVYFHDAAFGDSFLFKVS